MTDTARGILDEARDCVEAAEALCARVRVFGPICSAGLLAGLRRDRHCHIARAESLLEELKGQIVQSEKSYLDKDARIALIAASRP